jgi:hypothetical protein
MYSVDIFGMLSLKKKRKTFNMTQHPLIYFWLFSHKQIHFCEYIRKFTFFPKAPLNLCYSKHTPEPPSYHPVLTHSIQCPNPTRASCIRVRHCFQKLHEIWPLQIQHASSFHKLILFALYYRTQMSAKNTPTKSEHREADTTKEIWVEVNFTSG